MQEIAQFLAAVAEARSITDVNIAAGLALQALGLAHDEPLEGPLHLVSDEPSAAELR